MWRLVLDALRNHFPAEFLNRVDEIVLFKPLTLGEIELIADLTFNDLRARVVTEPGLRFIAEQGFDPASAPDRCGVSFPARLRSGVGQAPLRGDLHEGGEVC